MQQNIILLHSPDLSSTQSRLGALQAVRSPSCAPFYCHETINEQWCRRSCRNLWINVKALSVETTAVVEDCEFNKVFLLFYPQSE